MVLVPFGSMFVRSAPNHVFSALERRRAWLDARAFNGRAFEICRWLLGWPESAWLGTLHDGFKLRPHKV